MVEAVILVAEVCQETVGVVQGVQVALTKVAHLLLSQETVNKDLQIVLEIIKDMLTRDLHPAATAESGIIP